MTLPNTFGLERVVPLLPEFCGAHPALEIDLLFTEALVDLVAEGIDVAVRLAPLRDLTLVVLPILDIKYLVVCSPAWLRAQRSQPEPEDLRSIPCLCLSLPAFRERWMFRGHAELKATAVEVTPKILTSNGSALRELAVAGLGPALLADWLAERELAAGRLVDLFPDYEVTAKGAPSKAWALYATRSHVPAKVRAFIDFLHRAMAQPGPGRV